MKYLTLREIQVEETKMLKELVDFFDKENLTYYAWAGTLLGAVRHKGFIPWDDDIDLAMTRPEYNKFIKYLNEHDKKITDNLVVEGYELGNNDDFPILKVYNTKIKVDITKEMVDKYLWIDIFPLDGVPKNNLKFHKKCDKLHNILYLKREQKNNVDLLAANKIKKIIKTIFLFFLKLWPYKSYMKFYYNYCTKYNYDKSQYIKNTVMTDSSIAYEKSDFESYKLQFEGLTINGIKNYDRILSMGYGKDYMELPPEEKRVSHEFKAYKIK